MIELLAPAGEMESLRAAVLNGANAVYIGGKEFSARQYAGNFDRDEMVEAVRYCHAYNVKVYVTMNTLYENNELNEAVKYAAFLYSIGVDAVIIQDIGFLKLLREHLPELEVHGSTQMTVHNLEAVELLYNMGVKRIVLARELSLKEIEHIAKNTRAEIEVFIHGALCISFSGQCLFSSMIGGRSGNRGRCAQPCRMEYSMDGGEKAHYLSPKDLSTLEFINKVVGTGVHSLKIEGRMKRPEYVATVVSSYRRAIEGAHRERDVERVTQIFNRGGFTSAHLLEKQGRNMMSYERPKNWGTYLGKVIQTKGKFAAILLEKPLIAGDGVEVFNRGIGAPVGGIKVKGRDVARAEKGDTAEIYLEGAKPGDVIYKSLDSELIKEAEESFRGKDILKVPLIGEFTAHKGSQTALEIENMDKVTVKVLGDEPEKAVKTPTDAEKITVALAKTKDTPFYFEGIEVDIDDDIVIPVSKINGLRREAVEKLVDSLQGKKELKNINISFKVKKERVEPEITVKTGRIDAAKASIDAGCEVLFFGGDNLRINSGSFREVMDYGRGRVKIYPWYPEIILEEGEKYKRQAEELGKMGINGALCGNLGFYAYLKDKGFNPYLDKGFNIFNSAACETFENSGCLLSPELTVSQLKSLISKTDNRTMVLAYGRIKLMVSRHCFVGSSKGHGREGCPNLCGSDIHYLKDRTGEEFPVLTDWSCRSHIYNSKILCAIEHIKDIRSLNCDNIVLEFVDEKPEEAFLAVKAFKEALESSAKGEYGLKDSGLKLLDRLKGKITKGHLYRGVL